MRRQIKGKSLFQASLVIKIALERQILDGVCTFSNRLLPGACFQEGRDGLFSVALAHSFM
jgi:hypothetical protein